MGRVWTALVELCLAAFPGGRPPLPARPLAAAQSKYQDPHINPRTPSCLLAPSRIKQALKLLTFRPVTLLVSGGGSVGAGGRLPSPRPDASQTGPGTRQAGAAPPEAGRGPVTLESVNSPGRTLPPCRGASAGPLRPHLAELDGSHTRARRRAGCFQASGRKL